MLFHPYASWDAPDPEYTPIITGVLPSNSTRTMEHSVRLNAHLRGVPYSSSSSLRRTAGLDPRSQPESSNSTSYSSPSLNGLFTLSSSEHQDGLSPYAKTLTVDCQESQSFTFATMKPDSLTNCLVVDGFNRPVLQIKTDLSPLGVNTVTTVSSEREVLASVEWQSTPPRVSIKGYGTTNISDWITWMEVPLLTEKWRMTTDVPCFKTMICGVPAVWEFDQKNFYLCDQGNRNKLYACLSRDVHGTRRSGCSLKLSDEAMGLDMLSQIVVCAILLL